jgi:hypothetical protein
MARCRAAARRSAECRRAPRSKPMLSPAPDPVGLAEVPPRSSSGPGPPNAPLPRRPNAKLVGMDAALAGLLGASNGTITGVFGGFIAGWQQRKGEALHWKQARADERRKEERRSLLELTSLLAEGSQVAAWLSWAATAKPADAVKADAHEYDARMRAILPRLFSAQAAASGLRLARTFSWAGPGGGDTEERWDEGSGYTQRDRQGGAERGGAGVGAGCGEGVPRRLLRVPSRAFTGGRGGGMPAAVFQEGLGR